MGFIVIAGESLEINLKGITMQSLSIFINVLQKRFFVKSSYTAEVSTPIGGIYGASLTIVRNEF